MRQMHRSPVIVMLAAVLAAVVVRHPSAQEPDASLSFEVASVKPNTAAPGGPMMLAPKGDRLVVTNLPVLSLLTMAYQLRPHQLVDPPTWTMTERFDVHAKVPAGVSLVNPQATQQPFIGVEGTPQPFMLMMRRLLADRFGLKYHREFRELPVYRLVKARGDGRLGPKLKTSTVDCQAIMLKAREGNGPAPMPSGPPKPGDPPSCFMFGGMGRLAHASLPMSTLALLLEGPAGRTVQDHTGLEGTFEFELTFTPEQFARMAEAGRPLPQIPGMTIDLNGPSIFTALQEQLGLKLEAAKAPVEVFVIDSVSRPTPD